MLSSLTLTKGGVRLDMEAMERWKEMKSEKGEKPEAEIHS